MDGTAFIQASPAVSVGAKRPLEQAPEGSWQCERCGNVNWPLRSICNIRTCQAPRPGVVVDPAAKRAKTATPAAAADGSWTCQLCGNLNLPGRLVCNMRKCQSPRPPMDWLCSCGNLNYKHRTVCNSKKCGRANPALLAQQAMLLRALPGALAAVPVPAPQFQPPHGLQPTPLLQHSQEQQLHHLQQLQLLQLQQSQLLAGSMVPAAAAAASPSFVPPVALSAAVAAAAAPPGSWTCASCQNVNWPARTSCNRKTCGKPRPLMTLG